MRQRGDGFVVTTTNGEWRARTVVIASGPTTGRGPGRAPGAVPPGVTSVTPAEYRNPDQLDDGGVLVVGAAATGVQLADEIQRSGRPVTLAVGGHVRVPRVYRGMDIMWWLDAAGVLDERYDEVDDIVRARHVSSFQLVGSPHGDDRRPQLPPGHRRTDCSAASAGSPTTGRRSSPDPCRISARSPTSSSAGCSTPSTNGPPSRGLDREVEAAMRPAPTRVPAVPPLMLPLGSGEIKTIIWATGYRPEYPWLDVPVLDGKGRRAPRRRHHPGSRPVPDERHVPAPAEVHLHRRRRRRRPRTERPSGRLPR